MNRRRANLDNIFNIDIHVEEADDETSPGSSGRMSDDIRSTSEISGSRNPLTGSTQNFIRSYSEDCSHSLNNSGASKGNVRRWSQSLNKGARNGKKTVRQKTINFMPSRLQGAFPIDGQRLINHDSEIDQLTQEIEQHDHLMEDSALSEQLRIVTLRALPQSLTIKRQIKAKLSRTITNKSNKKVISQMKKFKYNVSMLWNRAKISSVNKFNEIELWYGSMKMIEGHFGSGVGTYFKFLRWLFSLNLLLVAMNIGFIIIPQIIFNNNSDTQETKNNSTTSSKNDEIEILNATKDFNFFDLFTAEGFLANSILFYGHYSNMTLTYGYSLPHAYFMTMICLYVATFIIVSISMARSYRRSFIETAGGIQNMYALKIFCSWDFGISNLKSAQLKHNSIFIELKEVLNDIYNTPESPKALKAFWILLGQITAHILVFSILAGLAIGMWSFLNIFGDNSKYANLSSLYVALLMNVAILVLQTFFTWIATMEDYKSAKLTLHVTMFRNYLLEVVIVGVLLVFWITDNYRTCWETSIGQQIYRLVIIDFLLFGIGGAFIHGLRYVIYRNWWPKIGLPEFDISSGSLGLVFNQTLLWVGLLFSPALAIIVAIKMVLTFYIKKTILIYFCKPPSSLWRSAQTSTLFLVMTFLSLLGVIVSNGYILTNVKVSSKCGPFRSYEYMFEIFLDGVLKLKQEHWFWRVLVFVTKPAVIGGILLTMCVTAYYLRSKSKAQIAMVKLLKEMLFLEAKDKEFLLSNITRITEGKDWLFDDIDIGTSFKDPYAESSSTWNYRNNNEKPQRGSDLSLNEPQRSTSGHYQRLSNDQLNVRNRRY